MPHSQTAVPRSPIRVLPPQLANQIAAGEVVERPASIIKELLENSLDAGASRITVSLEQGGLQLVQVQDDGVGIPAGELALAVSAHATSKIQRLEDLAAIASLGFRGEALASIASVSRLEITSRTPDAERGWRLKPGPAEDAEPELQPAAHPVGTTVQVSQLFFNTPARRRFLRTERTEYRHCEDVVRRLALAHPAVAWEFRHNGRKVFRLPAAVDPADRQRRLATLTGQAFSRQAVALDFEHAGLRLSGWVGPAAAARPRADVQFVFVNGRIIRDRLISHAVRQAYQDRIAPGRHPAYVLYLEVDPASVDVNVHPTKHEVRFQEARRVHDFLGRSVSEALAEEAATRSELPYAREALDWHVPATGNAPPAPAPLQSETVAERGRRYASPSRARTTGTAPAELTLLPGEAYALWNHPIGLLLLDIRQLIETRLLAGFAAQAEGLRGRPLLIPATLNVPEAAADRVEAARAELAQWGLELDRSGPASLMLRAVPTLLEDVDVVRLLHEVLPRLSTDFRGSAAPAMKLAEALAARAGACPRDGWTAARLAPVLADLPDDAEVLSHPAVRRFDPAELFRRG
jgi:DNA mismatch repair protein MutL